MISLISIVETYEGARMAKATDRQNNQFVVSFGDVQLPEALAHRIDVAIRKAALSVLAEADLYPENGFHIKPPIGWPGLVCRIENISFADVFAARERGNLGHEFENPLHGHGNG